MSEGQQLAATWLLAESSSPGNNRGFQVRLPPLGPGHLPLSPYSAHRVLAKICTGPIHPPPHQTRSWRTDVSRPDLQGQQFQVLNPPEQWKQHVAATVCHHGASASLSHRSAASGGVTCASGDTLQPSDRPHYASSSERRSPYSVAPSAERPVSDLLPQSHSPWCPVLP